MEGTTRGPLQKMEGTTRGPPGTPAKNGGDHTTVREGPRGPLGKMEGTTGDPCKNGGDHTGTPAKNGGGHTGTTGGPLQKMEGATRQFAAVPGDPCKKWRGPHLILFGLYNNISRQGETGGDTLEYYTNPLA